MERVTVIAVFLCMMMISLLVAHAVVFSILGDKCVWLVKGYRDLPKEKRERYDPDLVVQGTRNKLLLWAVWFAAGAVSSWAFTPFLVLIFFVGWIWSFVREMKFQEKKYQKYKKKLTD